MESTIMGYIGFALELTAWRVTGKQSNVGHSNLQDRKAKRLDQGLEPA